MDEYYRVVRSLPPWLAQPLAALLPETASEVQEIRLRLGAPVILTLRGRQCPVNTLPEFPEQLRKLRLTGTRLEETFHILCGGTVHAHQTELAQGYLTTGEGCRVGVAGNFVEQVGRETVLRYVTSLNLRIARAKQTDLPEVLRQLLRGHFTGLAVIGEPGSGKTTILRQMAQELTALGKTVTVIDQRRELFPLPYLAQGAVVDCLSGLSKQKAVQMALRTLSPQVILLDELGGMEEVLGLEQGFFSGVDLVVTLHAPDLEEAFRRPQVQALYRKGMLRAAVLLADRSTPGQIREVRQL